MVRNQLPAQVVNFRPVKKAISIRENNSTKIVIL